METIDMTEWLIHNKEWFFSGLGIAIISAIFAIINMRRSKNDQGHVHVSGDKNVIGNGNVVQITHPAAEKQTSNIKIVDISTHEDGALIVDIKLRNIGEQVAFIKEISFDILDYYAMENPQITHYQLVEASKTYDVLLGKEDRQLLKVSQGVGANEVDRFQIKLASSIAEARMVTIYYLSLSIIYDEDNKVVTSGNYLWAVPSISEYAAYFISHTDMKIAKKNYLALKKMDHYDAMKSNEFIGILESYEKNKSDFLD